MHSLLRSLRASLVISASLCLGFVSSAQALSLADLLVPGIVLDSGTLRFSEFAYSKTGDMANAEDITVVMSMDMDGNAGISITGNFMDSSSSAGPSGASISYSVSVLDSLSPDLVIEAVNIGATFDLDGPGYANLTGNVLNGSLELIQLFSHVFEGGSDTSPMNPVMKSLSFPSGQISVVMDNIDAFSFLSSAISPAEMASITTIDQTFSVVPEPGTALLLGIGLAGLGLAGKQS